MTQTDKTSGLLIPDPEHIQTSCDVPLLATAFPSISELKIDKLYFRIGWERKIVIILLTKILPAKEEINSILIWRLLNWQVLHRKSYHYGLNYGNVRTCFMGLPRGLAVKNVLAMWEPQETQVWSLGWEDPPGGGHGNPLHILAWRILWTEEPAGYSPWGCKESDMTEWLSTHTRNVLYIQHFLITTNLLNMHTLSIFFIRKHRMFIEDSTENSCDLFVLNKLIKCV